MSIGSALAEARERAGLSVADVSARTRIRATLVRAIERDDFAACGGDFYARGHIRAIARAVGVDSLPLIAEFDTVRPGVKPATLDDLLSGPPDAAPGVPASGNVRKSGSQPKLTETAEAGEAAGLGAGPGAAAGSEAAAPAPAPTPRPETQPDMPSGAAPDEAAAETPSGDATQAPVEGAGVGAGDSILNPAAFDPLAYDPVPDPAPTGPTAGTYQGRRRTRPAPVPWRAVPIALGALAVIAIGVYRVSVPPRSGPARPAAASRPAPSLKPASHSPTAAPSPSNSPSPSASAPPKASLMTVKPQSAMAYGPSGTSDGDNQDHASRALSGNAGSPWQSQWYTTSAFGNLKSGTGLLFDLGKTVRVKAVTVQLGNTSGASIQVRAGDSMGGLHTVATISGAGSDVRVPLSSPVSARYLVVWFTALPSNGNGTYQASVSGLSVSAISV